LDDVVFRDDNEWYDSFLTISSQQHKSNFLSECSSKSSLEFYESIKQTPFLENYLTSSNDFVGQRLKFKARTGCLGIGTDLKRRKCDDGFCKLCSLHPIDDLTHRFFTCSHNQRERIDFYNRIKTSCSPDVFNMFLTLPLNEKLKWCLGDVVFSIWGKDQGFLFDKCVKQFLVTINNDILNS
ncbi:unnamed protein product, partial [Owenia fusiformis]